MMSTQVQPSPLLLVRRAAATALPTRARSYVAGVLLLAVAYYAAAKLGETLRYTAAVTAVWPPAGVGIAALYLCGLRWWPGVFLAELAVNAELLLGSSPLPLGSLAGQQAGNMAEVIVGAALLSRWAGRRVGLGRVDQVAGMLAALAAAAAISAIAGTSSMLAGGVIAVSEIPTFIRTWWLADLAGAVVVVGLIVTWSRGPADAWRRLRTWEGALMVATVGGLGLMAVSINEPATYVVFPALIWAAFRFGPAGAALAVAMASALAIGITAADGGLFFRQPIGDRTLGTQIYIVVTAVTTFILSAIVSERERSACQLAEARLREGERAVEERQRIARDLHDSVSQALFSTVLHTRLAQRTLREASVSPPAPVEHALSTIAELTRGAQSEMRTLISELAADPLTGGLVPALARHAETVAAQNGVRVAFDAPDPALGLTPATEAHLFRIGREALANCTKHAGATRIWVRVHTGPYRVILEVGDNGCGFDPGAAHARHFGLDSMRSRAAEIGARLCITSFPERGTVVRASVPTGTHDDR